MGQDGILGSCGVRFAGETHGRVAAISKLRDVVFFGEAKKEEWGHTAALANIY
jgi:hypothetical protein